MKSIVFDLDGTLIDSARDFRVAVNRMLADLNLLPLDLETVIGYIGRSVEVLVERVIKHRNANLDRAGCRAALTAFRYYYAAEPVALTRSYPGVPNMLDILHSRGFALGICTNKPEAPAREICIALGLADAIGVITGGDTLKVKKPEAAPLLHTIEALGGTAAETLFVGDSETDYLAARNAHVRFAYFEGGYQRGAIANFRPDFRIAGMDEVLEIAESF